MKTMRPLGRVLAFAVPLAALTMPEASLQELLSRHLSGTSLQEWLPGVEAFPAFVALGGMTVIILLAVGISRMHSASRGVPAGGSSAAATQLAAFRVDRHDREFLPAALELFETPPSPIRVAGIWLICCAFTAALAWSYLGWLEIHAVAEGRIQPSGRSKVVQPLETGKVVTIGVENGSRVNAGDLLVELDARETDADRKHQQREREAALAEAARRRVAIDAARAQTTSIPSVAYPDGISPEIASREDGVLAAELAQLHSDRASLAAQHAERAATRNRLIASLASREKLIGLHKEYVQMLETLNVTKTASRAQVIERLQQYQALLTTQVGEKGQLEEVEASLATLQRRLEAATTQFVADQMQKLAESARLADQLQQELVKAITRNERTRLTAPISGTVQELVLTTVGQVVAPGQALMTIVPLDAPIEIAAMIENGDIGFVEPGQAAVIKIQSFPFTRFGTIDGVVMNVSRDAVDQRAADSLGDPRSAAKQGAREGDEPKPGQNLVFPATVSLASPYIRIDGKQIPLSPGMAVTVEINTGSRRALDYVLSPLREVTASAGHER
jgi:hemolysin D